METITVRSIPLGNTQWLDCTRCGPLGIAEPDQAHAMALAHLAEHGITPHTP